MTDLPHEGELPGDDMTTREIERRAPMVLASSTGLSDEDIKRTWRVAQALAASRMFKDANQAEQAFAKILIGRDLGLTAAQSMTGIHIVEGKPELAATTLAMFVQRHERDYDYRVVEHTNTKCVIEFTRDGETIGVSEFSMEDAERAGLTNPTRNGQPSNYTKYPRNMLFARAMSNGVKWYCPEVTGGVPVYVEGEIVESTATLVNGGADTGALEEGEPDWGEDPTVAQHLRSLFDTANEMREGAFLPTKIRMLLRGRDDAGRRALVSEMEEWITSKGGTLPDRLLDVPLDEEHGNEPDPVAEAEVVPDGPTDL